MNVRVVNIATNERPAVDVQHADVVGNGTVKTIGVLSSRTSRVLITLEGADARVTFDGRDPSNAAGSEVGHWYYEGAVFDLNRSTAQEMKIIEKTAGSPYTLRITEFE